MSRRAAADESRAGERDLSRGDPRDTSRSGRGDRSPLGPRDLSQLEDSSGGARCAFCRGPLPPPCTFGPPRVFCRKRCRQRSSRLHLRKEEIATASRPGRFAYADPPYPGKSARFYRHEPTYAGEVDHAQLIARLVRRSFTGWALSTSEDALRDVLPLCPAGARVCVWVKPHSMPRGIGLTNRWEAIIVVGGRQTGRAVRDWLLAGPDRSGATLPGRKPDAFCAYLFDALGMIPGVDEFEDWFPGTGRVLRAWEDLSARAQRDRSRAAACDSSRDVAGDPSPPSAPATGDRSREVLRDRSATAGRDMSPVDVVDRSRRCSGDRS